MVKEALRASNLVKVYGHRSGRPVAAVSDVSLQLEAGKTLGVVGESGCGKSTLGRLLVGLEAPDSGQVEIAGRAMGIGAPVERRERARSIQLVFQDPFSSLDPRLTIDKALDEVLKVHGLHASRRGERVAELLAMVGLARRFASRYPHELSGGQAQRVAIARALAVEPAIFVLDEPTSSLDVSVRAEIINLLVTLQDQLGLSYVFISHDLSIVRHISDEIAVMYLGRIVERGPFDKVFGAEGHPYTAALAEATPRPDPAHERARPVEVPVSVAAALPEGSKGCPYAPRCALARASCLEARPELEELSPGHLAACWVAQERRREASTQRSEPRLGG